MCSVRMVPSPKRTSAESAFLESAASTPSSDAAKASKTAILSHMRVLDALRWEKFVKLLVAREFYIPVFTTSLRPHFVILLQGACRDVSDGERFRGRPRNFYFAHLGSAAKNGKLRSIVRELADGETHDRNVRLRIHRGDAADQRTGRSYHQVRIAAGSFHGEGRRTLRGIIVFAGKTACRARDDERQQCNGQKFRPN